MNEHFYAYLSRLKHIKRWGLMRNTEQENVAEHTFSVTLAAHALCLIKNRLFGGEVSEKDVLCAALYHEAAEVITGDLPTPIKYYDQNITEAYKQIEHTAEETLLKMLPEELREEISPYVFQTVDEDVNNIVKAADRICAYIKCIEEQKSGNDEFSKAAERIKEAIERMDLPEANYFTEHFLPSYFLTLDELNEPSVQ